MDFLSENLNPSPCPGQILDSDISLRNNENLITGLDCTKKMRSDLASPNFLEPNVTINPNSSTTNLEYGSKEYITESSQLAEPSIVNGSSSEGILDLKDANNSNGNHINSSSKRSCVLYLRRLPNKVNEVDLAALATPFGNIKNMVVTKFSGHALIEMTNEEDAVAMENFYNNVFPAFIPPSSNLSPLHQVNVQKPFLMAPMNYPNALGNIVNDENKISVQFSRYQNLTTKVVSAQIQNVIKNANMQSYYIDLNKKRVLRVHIKDCPESIKLNHIILYKIFQRFGTILRIIVFKVNTFFPQAFVEFENHRNAAVAKLFMNTIPLSNRGGFLQVDYSSQETIEIRKTNELNRDYTKEPLTSNDTYALDFLEKNFGDFTSPIYGINPNIIDDLKKINPKSQTQLLAAGLPQMNGTGSVADQYLGLNDLYAQIFSMQQYLQERLKCGDKFSADQARFYVNILAETLSQALNVQHSQNPLHPSHHLHHPHSHHHHHQANVGNVTNLSHKAIIPQGNNNKSKAVVPVNCNKPDLIFPSAKDPSQSFQNIIPNNCSSNQIRNNKRKDDCLMPGSNIKLPSDVGYGFKTFFVPVNASPVIIVSHLDPKKVTPDILFTLFGVYGDVIRVKIMYSKRDTALVQFADSLQAAVAIDNLSGQTLFGKKMLCNESKYYQIKLPSKLLLLKGKQVNNSTTISDEANPIKDKGTSSGLEEPSIENNKDNLGNDIVTTEDNQVDNVEEEDAEMIDGEKEVNYKLAMSLTKDYFDSPLHRYKKANSRNFANIYPPSSVLHISNLPADVTIDDLLKAFESNGHCVVKSKLMVGERRMALLQFNNVELAIIALIGMHNYPITPENRIRVCFSRSQISEANNKSTSSGGGYHHGNSVMSQGDENTLMNHINDNGRQTPNIHNNNTDHNNSSENNNDEPTKVSSNADLIDANGSAENGSSSSSGNLHEQHHQSSDVIKNDSHEVFEEKLVNNLIDESSSNDWKIY